MGYDDTLLSWNEAKIQCRKLGKKHNLAAIHSKEEQVFLNSLMGLYNESVWVGLGHTPGYPYTFSWADNTKMDFTFWAPNEPKYSAWHPLCGALSSDKILTGKWHTLNCQEPLGYICQQYKDPTLSTPAPDESECSKELWDFKNYRSSCYHMFTASELKRSWQEAEILCANYGGHLASINDGGEQAFIQASYLNTYENSAVDLAWIGMKIKHGTRIFEWSDKWHVLYTHWGREQPQTSNDDDNCVAITHTGEWNVTDCKTKLPFVCKVTKEVPPTVPDEFEKMSGVCPTQQDHWFDLGGRFCYLLNATVSYNFDDALHFCARHRAVLASFHSQHELDLLAPHMKHASDKVEALWIGLVAKSDGSYGWYDHSPLDFTNFLDESKLANPSGSEKCIVMDIHGQKWKFVSCGSHIRHGVICQAAKDPHPVTVMQMTTTVTPEKLDNLTAGMIVAIVSCVIVVTISIGVVVLAIFKKFRRKQTNPSGSFENKTYDPFFTSSTELNT